MFKYWLAWHGIDCELIFLFNLQLQYVHIFIDSLATDNKHKHWKRLMLTFLEFRSNINYTLINVQQTVSFLINSLFFQFFPIILDGAHLFLPLFNEKWKRSRKKIFFLLTQSKNFTYLLSGDRKKGSERPDKHRQSKSVWLRTEADEK